MNTLTSFATRRIYLVCWMDNGIVYKGKSIVIVHMCWMNHIFLNDTLGCVVFSSEAQFC